MQIPNQHVKFHADPKNKTRYEDAIIAYTWRHFLEDPSKPEWLLRMPMTKASVKAMDTVTDFVNKTIGKEITNYCVGGASKVRNIWMCNFATQSKYTMSTRIASVMLFSTIWESKSYEFVALTIC